MEIRHTSVFAFIQLKLSSKGISRISANRL